MINRIAQVFVFISVLVLFAGCQTHKINEVRDDFDNDRYIDLRENWVKKPAGLLQVDRSTGFGFGARYHEGESENSYLIVIEYRSDDWFFIESGGSLQLLVDGKSHTFVGSGSARNREVNYGSVSETAFYDASRKTLSDISHADVVRVKVTGSKGWTEFTLTEKNKEALRDFLRQLPKESS